jgi:hypothetical protein
MADAFLLLRRVHLFSGLSDEQLRSVAARFKYEEHGPNVAIFHQGDLPEAFYMIDHGQVAVVRQKGMRDQTVAHLGDADFFGELGLMEGRPRSASAQTESDVGLWRLTAEDFYALVREFPQVKEELDVVVYTRKATQRKSFPWLEPDEVVYLIAGKHTTLFFLSIIPAILLFLLALAGAAVAGPYFGLPVLSYVAAGAAVLLVGWMIWHYIDWDNDLYIVTNKRVIDYEKIVLIYDSRIEAPLTTCRNVNVATSQLGRILDYGDVVVNTFTGNIIFHYVPHPKAIADLVQEQLNRSRLRTQQADRQALKRTLRQSMGLEKPLNPQTAPIKPVRPQRPGTPHPIRQAVGHFNFRVRTEMGGVVTYHKHPLVLLQRLALPTLLLLGLLFLLGSRILGGITLLAGPAFFVAWLVPALVVAGWWLYQYVDWRNDIYQVTPEQILDISRKPLGQEVRKTAPLANVLNIKTDRPGLLALILNFGSVIIQTGPGGEMRFQDVFAPLEVQQDIFRRIEMRQQKAQADQVAAERDRLSKVLGAFYEITLDEQRDRLEQRLRALREQASLVDANLKDIQDRIAVYEEALVLAPDTGLDELAVERLEQSRERATEEYTVVALRRKALDDDIQSVERDLRMTEEWREAAVQ